MLDFFKKSWFILGESKSKIPFLLSVFIFSSLLEAFGIGLLGPFFQAISNLETIQDQRITGWLYRTLGTSSTSNFIISLSLLITAVFVGKSVLYFLSKFYIIRFSHAHRAEIVRRLNSSYLNSRYDAFLKKNSADFISHLIIESQNFNHQVILKSLYGISNLIILFFLFILLATTDLSLLAATLATFLPVIIFFYSIRGRIRTWGASVSKSQQAFVKTLNHGLGGFKETRIIGCEGYFQDQMNDHLQQYIHSASWSMSIEMLPRILIEAILVIFIVLFVGISVATNVSQSEQLIATLSVFGVASIRLLPAVSQVVHMFSSLQKSRHTVDILYLDLKEIDQLQGLDQNSLPAISTVKGKDFVFNSNFNQVNLSGIKYSYPNVLDPAVNDVSLTLSKGESIAFIGKSGSGKTTLVDIILGLLVPQSGNIDVDGQSIYTDLRAWQNLIGYIPQSIFLLDDTVEHNIAFGVPDHLIDAERLAQAIKAAQLDELVSQLTDGVKTPVGERGARLSGGQRQRIGIARALYHERQILILDEATSALDNETERLVTDAINALAGSKTLITIAHRLSTVERCDRIYVLKEGRIVKSGRYHEVISAVSAEKSPVNVRS